MAAIQQFAQQNMTIGENIRNNIFDCAFMNKSMVDIDNVTLYT